MKVLDLFSGIGGFSLGLERAGFETAAFCEIEPFCQKVLRKHWPDVPIYDDVRTLTAEKLKDDGIDDIGLVCGGYPCQPFSHAGKRAGEADDRHLWPEMYRIIADIRPRWVIAENVAGHINMGLDNVLSDLEAANYTWWTFVIPACAVDAKHRRDRVWIVANSEGDGDSQQRQPPCGEDTAAQKRPGRADEFCPMGGAGAAGNAITAKNDANPNGAGSHRAEVNEQRKIKPTDGKKRDSGPVCEVLAGRGNADVGGSEAVAYTERERQQGSGEPVNPGGSAPEGKGEADYVVNVGEPQFWATEPNVGRVAARIPLGLDDCRGRLDGYAKALARAKGVTEDSAITGCLRALRRYGDIGETSPQLRRPGCVRDSLQEVSLRVAQNRKAGVPYEEMRDLWDEISTQPLEETQDLFKEVLVGNWEAQCDEALGQRTNRLKSLGNAVVPQVVEMIGRAVMGSGE